MRLRRKAEGAKKAGLIATYCAAQYFCCIAPKGRIYRAHPGGSGVCGLRTAATRRCHTRHGSAPGADPCEAELSPPKGSLNDRGNRDDHLQVQIQGSFAGRVRYAEIRIAELRDSQNGNSGRLPRDRREERLAGERDLRKDEISR